MQLLDKTNKNLGFTLLELMITVAIIAILATMAVASYHFAYQRTYDSRAKTIIMATALAEEHYFSVNDAYIACNNDCVALLPTLTNADDVDITVNVPSPQDGTFTITGSHQNSSNTYSYDSTTGVITEI